ncbi:iron complex outermembrane recepter protein [Pseudoalteromonas tunicata]|uniref:TonB-dependent receptor n=2 Tax=Pseudoalteromonas tunicata TaxID=314281 RepID=A4CAD5_9GAMM|nr:iron complex outermembrane recepter protein [Pseudoalteromonas tunicata]AXT30569.1 TonB-dependent receptor [Pseudoalteromonas tunicata]EAR28343.1 TonB-dependent receptor [Pseudoalteromonas tunicata D2]
MKGLALTTMCCLSFCTYGEQGPDLFSLSLEELTTIEIATKNKQTIYSSPSIVYVITRDQINEMGISNLQTLLNFVPGYQSTRDIEQGTANRISARGRSTALSESVLVQIDGNKINDLYTGGISILNRLIDLGNIERIEIIRGPGSALYGSNAFLGVINIITASNRNEMSVSVSHPNRVSSRFSLSHAFSEHKKLDFYLGVFDDAGDNYHLTDINGIEGETHDPINGLDAYLKQSWHDWLFTARYMKRQLNDFIALGSLGNDINKEQSQQWSFSAQYNGTWFNQLDYDVSFAHSQDKWQTQALLIPKEVEIFPDFSLATNFVGGPFLTSKNSKAAINVSYQASDNHLVSFGSAYEKAHISDVYTATTHDLFTLEPYQQSIKLVGDQSFSDRKSRKIVSLYLQDQIQLTTEWEVTAGIRYDYYNDFGHAISPRIAAVWKPEEKSSLKLMYGTAFRAPNFLELYDRNNYVDFGNVNLNAEEVETIEVSWLQTFENWHVEITAFNNDFKQLITLAAPVEHPENPFFSPSFTNNDGQKSRGVETELQFKLTQQFSIKVLWNWFTDDSDINIAQNTGAVMFDYQQAAWRFNLHGFYRGNNEAVANQSSYFVAAANASLSLSPHLTVNFALDNMFNQQYRTQSIVYEEGIANRGRAITLGMQYQF